MKIFELKITKSKLCKCELHNIPKSWYWDANSSNKFSTSLKSEEASERLKQALEIPNASDMATEINDILLTAAEKSGIKKKSHREREPNINNNPWYDQECKQLKIEIRKTAEKLRRNPGIIMIRDNLYKLQKNIRALSR